MTAVLLLVGALLAGVAAAGVLVPFRNRGVNAEQRFDPLDDERASLLRALRDLDSERAIGSLGEDDYRALRVEIERRAVAVLRAIEARDGAGAISGDLRELKQARSVSGNGARGAADRGPARRGLRRSYLAPAVAGLLTVAVAVPLLLATVRNRTADQPVTGDSQTQTTPLQFFVDRVHQHPKDLAARLDLADAYLRVGDVQDSIQQYLEALRIDPTNPEALATLGFLLYQGGKPQEALDAENKALTSVSNFPEALYYKGVILLEGLNRPADAAEALRAYLAAAPFDTQARRQDAERLLAKAERGASSPGG